MRELVADSKLPEYRHWINMKSRCNTASSTGHENYGGRGIRVCEEWNKSFRAFYNSMGPRPSAGHSLDRIDVNGNYEPGNCRWATASEQARNWRDNHLIEAFGTRMSITEAAERAGLKPNTVYYRLKRGWPESSAVSRAPHKGVRPDAA